jgi:hypothetical protein
MSRVRCQKAVVVAVFAVACPGAALAQEALADLPPPSAGASISPKHLLILRPGLDAVFGTYVFAVQNPDEAPADFRSPVLIPKEAEDWFPQEGIEPADLDLDKETKGLTLKQKVESGVHILSIGFRVNGSFGKAKVTLVPPYEIGSLTVLVPRDSPLHISSPLLTAGGEGAAPDPQYQAWTTSAVLPQNGELVIEVRELPEGRGRLWVAGFITFLLLGAAGTTLAWRTRPKGEPAESELFGV